MPDAPIIKAEDFFDFSKLHRRRGSYQHTLSNYDKGLLSAGFMWELAKRDEVFAAFLRKNKVPSDA